jgi:hypothetical protein
VVEDTVFFEHDPNNEKIKAYRRIPRDAYDVKLTYKIKE